MSVKGKTILVTGSTDGVGRYVAERLGADGARVIVHGRDRARGQALVERIVKGGGEALFLEADLASLAEVRRLAEAVRRECDGLDVLVNNAGVGTAGAEARGQRRRLRIALRRQLSRRLSADAAPAALAGGARAVAHRQRRLRGPAGDRLFRRDADPRLQRRQSLLSEQARADPVHDRSRRGAQGSQRHGQRPASGHLHGYDHGADERHAADEHGGGGRLRHPSACRSLRRSRARAGSISAVRANRAPTPRPTTRPPASA